MYSAHTQWVNRGSPPVHADQLEKDVILVLPWNPKAELLADPDHVAPEGIVTVGLAKLIPLPLLLIKVLRIWSPV